VTGNVKPLKVNEGLLDVALVTVTLEPVALSLPCKTEFVPTTTLPKFSATGLTANCPAAVPEPDNGMLRVGFDAFEVSERVPLALPAEAGAKVTLNV
jgi:hypothetical protein